jgi:hypothetical protein
MMLTSLVEAALHSVLLGTATWVGLKLLRIKDPQAEMTVWKIVLVAAVAMPFLVPWTRVTIPDTHPDKPSPLASHSRADTSLPELGWLWPDTLSGVARQAPVPVDRFGAPSPALKPSSVTRAPEATRRIPIERIDWLGVATGLYLLVSGVLLLQLLIGLARLFRLARTARLLTVLPEGARVCTSELVAMPVTFASVIMLPSDWETWSRVKQRAVLAHELSHVARGDFYTLLFGSLYRIVFWFNPLSWWLLRRLGELMEMLSDDAAVADLGDAPAYAEVLLDVAASFRTAPMAIAMARTTRMRSRIERILARSAPPLGRRKRILMSASLAPLIALSAVTIARGTPPADPKASVVAQGTSSAEPPPRVAAADVPDSYVGYYSSSVPEPLVFTITREGDRLYLQRTGVFADSKVALFRKGDHTFNYVSAVGGPESELTFVLGNQGHATGIMLHEPGGDITARPVDEAEARRATELFNRRFASQQRLRVSVSVDPALFDRYIGHYKLDSRQVINVGRDGDQFFFQYAIPGREKIRLYPESEAEYFAETLHAQITFVIDPQGQVSGLISHQGGWSYQARRIGEAEAQQAEAAAAEQAREGVERRAAERRPREAVAVDRSVSDRDIGIYDAGYNGTSGPLFVITREDDQLFAQMSGQQKLPIFSEREHAYFFQGIPAQLTFMVDGQGPATRLTLHHSGRVIEAGRIGDLPKPDGQRSAVDPETFARYVGWYRLNPFMVVAVSRDGSHLFVQRSGQERFEVFPSKGGTYFADDGHAWIAFKTEGSDRAGEIMLYEAQTGAMRSARIDDAKGRSIQDSIAWREATAPDAFIAQKPAPGSEAMIRMAQSGAADGNLLGPRLADFLPRQLRFLREELIKLGTLRSLSFRGMALSGLDIYDARFDNGRAKITIGLGPDGKLDDANLQAESDGPSGGILACSEEPTLKSHVSSSFPDMMTIVNRTGGEIDMFGLSPSGDRVSSSVGPMPPIADGRSMQRMASASQPVVVTDGSGACLEIIMPGEATRTVVVRSRGASPRAAGGQAIPLPGAEDALRQYIDGVRRGAPDEAQMTPWAASVAQRTLRVQQAILAKLGAVQTVSFAGIGPNEDDLYRVKFDNGSVEWRIDLAQDGKIRRIALGPQ